MIRAARKALSARDFPALRICAHSLKGNSASVDSKSCAEVAKALEDFSRECDETHCSELLPKLESAFASAIDVLKSSHPELTETKALQQ